MPLLQTSDRPSAQQLLSRLRELERQAPREARRFHEAVRELATQIEESRGRLLPWVRNDELQQRAEEVQRLEGAAPYVVALFAQADGVRQKIQGFRRRLGRLREPEETTWLEERCVRWEAELETLGATLPRPSDVARARGSVADVEAGVDLHDEAVEWLERGHKVLRGLAEHGLEVEGATLEADLPAVTEAFRSNGPSRKALDELAGSVRALEDRLSSQPQEAPPQYTDAARILDRAEEWHRALEPLGHLPREETEVLASLRDRLETARRMWRRRDPEDADAVLVEAQELLEGAAESARRRRGEALHELRQQIRTLTQIAGSTQAEDEAAELETRDVEGPQAYSRWWEDLERAWSRFLAEAEIEADDLVERMTERSQEIETVLGTLSETPMGEGNRSRLYRIESGLREVERDVDAKAVLRSLQVLERLREEAGTLQADVEDAYRRLEARRAALIRRIATLQEEARRAGVPTLDLAPRVEELSERQAVSTLEEAEDAVAGLEVEADRVEAEVVAACSAAVQEATAAVERIVRTLEAAGSRSAPPAPPPPLHGTGVKEAADAVAEARRLRAGIEAEAAEVWAELTERRTALLARIERLPIDALRPGDRDDAERLAEELRAGPWDEAESPADRIDLLLQVVARAEELFARLAREEDEARQRLAALRRRFDRAKEEGLHEAWGDLGDRLEALVRGLPEEPVRWPPVLHQIARAEELLGRLEVHARRFAVAELGAAVELIQERRHREEDPEIDLVLAELAEIDPHELPPTALRRRILRAASSHGGATGRRRHG